MAKGRCKTCRWAVPFRKMKPLSGALVTVPFDGFCTRFPPVYCHDVGAHFVTTRKDWGCGEWEEKE